MSMRGKGLQSSLIVAVAVVAGLIMPASAYQLPDSGQTKCYQTLDPFSEMPCAGTGQDGDYSIYPMSYNDNGDGTVTDQNTGLMWQQADDDAQYNWYQASGQYHAISNPTSQNVCASVTTGGHADWRLPTKRELMSIVDYGILAPGLTISSGFFPNTKPTGYWSSTLYARDPNNALFVEFDRAYAHHDGFLFPDNKSSALYVRCVRGENVGSLQDNANGTVTDNRTGLVWQQDEPGVMAWDAALSYCAGSSLAGYLDWRLPNIKELESLVDAGRFDPAVDTTLFPGALPLYYWSATTNVNLPDSAWYVGFNDGYVRGNYAKTIAIYVRCLRGGIPGDTTPDQFSFEDRLDVALSASIISNTINIAGLSAPTSVSIAGGEYAVNGGAYTAAAGTVVNGDQVTVHVTSAANYATTVDATLTIGGVSDTYSVSTRTALSDAGQTKCYLGVGPYAEISCPGTGQDGAYNINPMNLTVNGDGTVTDHNTGLMWQQLDDGTTYNWYQATGTFEPTHNPTSLNVCASLAEGGHADWRLPSRDELTSLVDYARFSPGPTISTAYFPNAQSADYWSSDSAAYFGGYAWIVYFSSGAVNPDAKSSPLHVRCVRGGVPQSPVRFVAQGDGTVADTRTGLLWQQNEPGSMAWDAALSYCQGLDLGGNSDWRLPNVRELASLVDTTRTAPALDTSVFAVLSTNALSWTSTTSGASHDSAWGLHFWAGGVLTSTKDAAAYVRCLQGGEVSSITPFAFEDQAGAELSALVASNDITISGVAAPVEVSVLGGAYSVNGGAYTAAAGTVINGDQVTVRVTSAATFATTVDATLTIGGVSDTFSVATMDRPPVVATGGTITHAGGYTIHTFTGSGTFTLSQAGEVEFLVVAGGGGGGGAYHGGGGGAGGMLAGFGKPLTPGSYPVTVGGGGAGGGWNTRGSNGSDSIFAELTAFGGGGGGGQNDNGQGLNGGSGGGAGGSSGGIGIGTAGQGYDGGATNTTYGNGGGGGGAGGPGQNATATSGGSGGPGLSSSISGNPVSYSGGGGASAYSGYGGSPGAGGSGGGGNGGFGDGTNGAPNTGGGGGGAERDGTGQAGSGGSGIVIVRYLEDAVPNAFAFADQSGVALSIPVVSNQVLVGGINIAASISIAGGQYAINGGAYTAAPGTAANGDQVMVLVTPAATYATTVNATLTIGGVSDTFSVTTRANTAPVIGTLNDRTVEAGTLLRVLVPVTNPDGDALSFSVPAGPGAVDTATHVFSWTPTLADVGVDTVTILVTDGELTDQKSFTVTVVTPTAVPRYLPDSGQTTCYQAMAPFAEVLCADTGQDGAYRINLMDFSDNGDGTVTDHNTGLVWQQGAMGGNWYEAFGVYHGGYNPQSHDLCGTLSLSGATDWRLPTVVELQSIVDYGASAPSIPTAYFAGTAPAPYWSSDDTTGNPMTSWFVWFSSGGVQKFDGFKHYSLWIRCVRGTPLPEASFVDNQNGTVTDVSTGLVWQQGEPGVMAWGDAIAYCEGLDLGDSTAWRLPNIKELSSLSTVHYYSPALDQTFFPGVQMNYYLSSSTMYGGWSEPWVVSFDGGEARNGPVKETASANVRCVRGGNNQSPDQFSFGDQGGVNLSVPVVSNAVSVVGITGPSRISITGGEYAVNGGAYTSAPGTVANGDQVMVLVTSAATYATTVDATLTIGGVSDTFSVTTYAAVQTTELFDDFEGAAVDSGIWAPFGTPASTIEPVGFNSIQSLDPQGDSWCESGLNSIDSFSPVSTVLSADLRIDGTTGFYEHVEVLLSDPNSPTTGTCHEEGEKSWVAGFEFNGYPGNSIKYRVNATDVFQEPIDTAWHHFEMHVLEDGTTRFVRDGILVHEAADRFDFASWPLVNVSVMGRSDAHPAFADNVRLARLDSPDVIPDQFTFVDQGNAALSAQVLSNALDITGLGTASPISIAGGEYSVNGGAYTSAPGTAVNGNQVTVRVTSAATYATHVDATLTIGGVSDTFRVTTAADAPSVGLVARYDFNGDASDSSGNGNNGTVYGAVPATDRFGNAGSAYSFDGVNDYLIVPDSATLNPAQVTYAMWVNLPSNAPFWGAALAEKDGWDAGSTGCLLAIGGWSGDNTVRWEKYNPSWQVLDSTVGLSLNGWHHVAASFDGSTLKIFIDGQLDNSLSAPGSISAGNDGIFGMGARFNNTGVVVQDTFFPGRIDDYRIYNRALSDVEVAQLAADAPDTVPASFSFVDQAGVALGTVVVSNPIAISEITGPAPITVDGGEYSINGGANTSAPGTVANGDQVTVRVTSAPTRATTVDAALTIGGVSDTFSVTTWGTPGTVQWSYATGGGVISSPAIDADGSVYVGSSDFKLYAVNADGTLKWFYTTGGDISFSSPAIGGDGTIYVGNSDDKLYAIHPAGTLKWTYTTGGTYVSSPAVGADGVVYVGTETEGRLYAIHPNGTLKWSYAAGSHVYGAPAIGTDGTIYVGSYYNHKLHAVNPNGTLKWAYTVGGDIGVSSPAIDADGTIYVGTANEGGSVNTLYAINPNGTLKWTYSTSGRIFTTPVIGLDGAIYVGDYENKRLCAVNPNGSPRWSYTTGGAMTASPAIGSDGTIYVGSADGKLHAVGPSGTARWTYATGNAISYSSPAIGADGTIYVGSGDNKLYAIYGSGTLADTPWPKFHHDNRNTGSLSTPAASPVENVSTGLRYSTIQAAIDAPETLGGHTIHVAPGLYSEHVTIGKSVTLQGDHRDSTTIDGGGTGKVVTITASNVTMSGFTIRNGGGATSYPADAGVYVNGASSSTITDCRIGANNALGVAFQPSSSNNTVRNCLIHDNARSGVNLGDSNSQVNNTIEDNEIFANGEHGIVGYVTTDGTIVRRNRIHDNAGFGVLVGWSQWTIEDNHIYDNDAGISIDTSRDSVIRRNTITGNVQYGIAVTGIGSLGNQLIELNNIERNNGPGVALACFARNNTVRNNVLLGNQKGIWIQNNGVYPNYNNRIYGNHIASNTVQAQDDSPQADYWDNGSSEGGNSWSDWTTPDANADGFVDNPRPIAGGYGQDNFPFAQDSSSILINGGAERTTNAVVELSLFSRNGAAVEMRFSDDGASWSAAEAFTTARAWTLPGGDGTKTVFVRFKDNAGTWSAAYSDTIVLDTEIVDQFTFVDRTGVALNASTISNSITVAGITVPKPITITGGEYSVNGGAYTAAAGTVANGDTVTVRVTSAAAYATAVDTTLTIGGVSDTFSVTTMIAVFLARELPYGDAGWAIDADNDGTTELVVLDTAARKLRLLDPNLDYAQEAEVSFAEPPAALAWGDMDGDGRTELVVGTSDSINGGFVYVGEVQGTTWVQEGKSPATGHIQFPRALAVGDYDGDGAMEVAVGISFYGRQLRVFDYSPGAGFQEKAAWAVNLGSDVLSVDTADVDDDGTPEYVVGTGCWSDYSTRVYRNGGIVYQERGGGYTLASTGDYDGDGLTDFVAGVGTACGGGSTAPGPQFRAYSHAGGSYHQTFALPGIPTPQEMHYHQGMFDVDGDGRSEVIGLTFSNNQIRNFKAYRYDGGTFREVWSGPEINNEYVKDIRGGILGGKRALILGTAGKVRIFEMGTGAAQEIPIGEALDNADLEYLTGGAAAFFGQNAVAHEGGDAVRSGAVGDGMSSWFTTTVTGPAQGSFWWKVSSEAAGDYLRFLVDGVPVFEISGDVDWQEIPWRFEDGGGHQLRWEYVKDGVAAVGADAGWVDRLTAGALPTGSILIDGGALHANSQTVTLTLSTSDAAVTAMRFRNDLAGAWSPDEPYQPAKSWTLSPGDGMKTVSVVFVDGDGNSSLEYSDTISLETAGLGAAVDNDALLFTTGGDAGWAGQTLVSHHDGDAAESGDLGDGQRAWFETTVNGKSGSFWWKVSSEQDYDLLKFFVDGTLKGSISGTLDWQEVQWSAKTAGAHLLRWEYEKDELTSDGADAGWVDKLVVGSPPLGSVLIAAGGASTGTRDVALALSASDTDGVSQMQFSNDQTGVWSDPEPYGTAKAWSLAAGDGVKKVHARFQDGAGNWSEPVNDTIVLDTTGPAGSVAINGGAPGTGSTAVTLSLSCTDAVGCADMQLSGDGVFDTEPIQGYAASAPWTLVPGDGTKTVQARFRDTSGNWSAACSDTIGLDGTEPIVSIASPVDNSCVFGAFEIGGTALDANLDRVEVQIRNGTFYLQPDGGWSTTPRWLAAELVLLPAATAWTYDAGSALWATGRYFLTARAFDVAGNSAEVASEFLYGSESDAHYTVLSVELSSQTILQTQSIDVFGKLTRLPEDPGTSLLGQSIGITITGPGDLPVPLRVIDGEGNEVDAPENVACDALGNFRLDGLVGFHEKGVYRVQAFYGGSEGLAPSLSEERYFLVGAEAGYAVIVVGRVPEDAAGLESHGKTAARVYRTLLDRGFAADNIAYFSYLAGWGVDGVPSLTGIGNAIVNPDPEVATDMASRMADVPAPLYLIMVDHGSNGAFHLEDAVISPEDLDGWLSTLEDALAGTSAAVEPRIVVNGSCYSGSFIPMLSKPGRVIITSASGDEQSYKGPNEEDGVRSGEFFLEELFKALDKGSSLRNAFVRATEKTENYTGNPGSGGSNGKYGDDSAQHPLLDDNGDHIGSNELSEDLEADGRVAEEIYLGVGKTNEAVNPAEFTTVSPTVFLAAGETSASLGGAVLDNSKVAAAWIEIKAPGIEPSGGAATGQLTLDLVKRPLMLKSNGRWECGTFPDTPGENCAFEFTEGGRYEIFYFTRRALTGDLSSMKRSVVYKNAKTDPVTGEPVENLPPSAFALGEPANGAATQTVLLLDWDETTDPDGDAVTYTVLVSRNAAFTDVVHTVEDLPHSEAMLGLEARLADLTTYFWKVVAVDAYGARTESAASSFHTDNTNPTFPGYVTGCVRDAVTSLAVASPAITASTGSVAPLSNGCYSLLGAPGTVVITAAKPGYQTKSVTVTIVSGTRVTANIPLVPFYRLTVKRSGNGQGSVSDGGGLSCGSACARTYDAGARVTLTESHNAAGTIFVEWGGACAGAGHTCVVTMDAAKQVTARFMAATQQLTVTKEGNGGGEVTDDAGSLSWLGDRGTAPYAYDTPVVLTALAEEGMYFGGWGGACEEFGTQLECTVAMDDAKSVVARFNATIQDLQVTILGTGGGRVTDDTSALGWSGNVGTAQFFYGTWVTLRAVADRGALFGGWSGGECGLEPTCTLLMNGRKEVTAIFAPSGGSVVRTDGGGLQVDGEPYTVKGVVYAPVPVGEDPDAAPPYGDYFTPAHREIYERDLPLIRGMNANTVRLLRWDGAADHADFLNKAFNGGTDPIRVIAGYAVDPLLDLSDSGVRTQLKADFRAMVAAHKDHPAILMWAIGDGVNGPGMYGADLGNLFTLVEEMAQEAHAEDSGHPVAVALADVDLTATIDAYDAGVPSLDLWGVSVYRGASFGTFFGDYGEASAKPVVVLGYGVDAYDNIRGAADEQRQSDFAATLWGEVANAAVCVGGTIMEYSDEWWLGRLADPECAAADVHDGCGFATEAMPDGYNNHEWWGIVGIADDPFDLAARDLVTTRAAYGKLQSLYWAPEGAVVINGGAAYTRSAAVGLAIKPPPEAQQMCVSGTATCTAWEPVAATRAWTLEPGDGAKQVNVWFQDGEGGVTPAPARDTIVLDSVAPLNGSVTGTPGTAQIALTWDGFADAGSDVGSYTVVYAVGKAPVSCVSGTTAYTGPETSYTHTRLTNVPYFYRVCARDRAGNLSTGATWNGRALKETTPPTGTVVINGGAEWTRRTAVTLSLTASDDSLPLRMCVSNTTSCTTWTAFAPTKAWVLTAANGVKAVNVWIRDAWGNVAPAPVFDTIVLDSVPPVNGTVTAAPGAGQIALAWSGFAPAEQIVGYRVVYALGAAPLSCAAGTEVHGYDGVSTAYVHTGLVNATYGYRVCAIDRAGNRSTGAIKSAKPLSTEAVPPIGSVVINGGADWTKSIAVTLTLTADDTSEPLQMCISNTTACTAWTAFAPTKAWVLPAGNGTRTVYAWFRDTWKNATPAGEPCSDTIGLDTALPVNGAVTATPGAGQIALAWSGFAPAEEIVGYRVVYALGAAPLSCAAGTEVPGYDGVSTAYVHTGLVNATYGYRVCAIDRAGNRSTGAIKSATPLSTEAVPPVGSVVINGGAEWTKSTAVTLTLTADDTSGPLQMCISNTTACTAWTAFATTKAWVLPAGNGTRTVYAWFRDTWKNATPAGEPCSDTIGLDTALPVNGAVTATPGAGQIALAWSGFAPAEEIVGYRVLYAVGAAPFSCAAGTEVPGYDGVSTAYVHTGLVNATYGYRVCAIDRAGNRSTGAIRSDRPLPTELVPPVGSVQINGGAGSTRRAAVTLTLTAADANAPIQMCLSNTATCSAWIAFTATKPWVLSATNGTQQVNVWFRDAWGNTTPIGSPRVDTIILDTVVPANGVVTGDTGDREIQLTWGGYTDTGSGIAGYKVVFALGTAPATCAAGTPLYTGADVTFAHTGLTNGLLYAYRVCALDKAGNVSTGKTWSGRPNP